MLEGVSGYLSWKYVKYFRKVVSKPVDDGDDEGGRKRTHVSVNVIRVPSIATLLPRIFDPSGHDLPHILTLDVEPVLVLPVLHGVAVVLLLNVVWSSRQSSRVPALK
jgi:hypothetical protein